MTGNRRMWAFLALGVLVLVSCGPRFGPTNTGGLAAPTAQPTVIPTSTQPTGGIPTPVATGGGGPTAIPTGPAFEGPGKIVTGGVIKVGGLFPLSGGLSALGTPAFQGADAYFNFVNQNGGVRGRKIEFITCDDQADDTRTTTCAKQLVEQRGVFVMGPSFTPFSLTVVGQLERQGVPWIGYDGINVEGFSARNVVTVGAPIETMAHVLLPYWYDEMKKEHGSAPKKIGAVVLDSAPALTYLAEARSGICAKLGCEIVRDQRINYTTTEYGTICRSMQNERVDAIWVITDPASAIKLLVQCQGIGYRPPMGFLGQHGIYLDLTLQQSGKFSEDILANGALLPASVNHPANREMRSIIRTYYPDASFGYFTQLAYASARMLVDLIDKVLAEGKELSQANILAAASSIHRYNCNGLCKNVDLQPPAAVTGGNHNVWIVRSDFSSGEGRWVYEDGPFDAFKARTWPCPGRPKPC